MQKSSSVRKNLYFFFQVDKAIYCNKVKLSQGFFLISDKSTGIFTKSFKDMFPLYVPFRLL